MSLAVPPPLSISAIALFLDIDGTLAEFRRLPQEVVATPRLVSLLTGLERRLAGRIAMISGRELVDMDRITAGAVVAASGVHGLEHRHADGRVERAPQHPGLEAAREAFAAIVAAHPRLVLEDKGLGLVLHYRTGPELAGLAEETAARVAAQTGLVLQRGDMMAEVHTPGRNKGDALTAFMQELPFRGHRPIYLGDDLTDEWAFRAAQELGGFGVLVGLERPTAATYRLENVAAVLAWLEALADAPTAAVVNG